MAILLSLYNSRLYKRQDKRGTVRDPTSCCLSVGCTNPINQLKLSHRNSTQENMAVKSEGSAVRTIAFDKIKEASKNIAGVLKETPIICIESFDKLFNHDVYFKLENFQETGAYKARGVINSLHNLKQRNKLPKKIVTYG